ncbi:MAG: AAA family ATPase, partial [Pirellulales bacterium]|nr:AAA family ATPase [Pirellulales bacterium]
MPSDTSYSNSKPHDLEAEKTVLGALLCDPDAILAVLPTLSVDDFYDLVYQSIYAACCRLHEQREPIDFVTVSSALKSDRKIESIGGSAFLADLAASVPTSSHAANYARIVKQNSLRRNLINTGNQITQLGYKEGIDPAELVEKSHLAVLSLTHSAVQSAPEPLGEISARRYDQIAELQAGADPADLRSVKTGFSNIDYYFNGLAAGSLSVLAARPSMGKTALAVDIAKRVASRGSNVLFVSLEMTKEEISDRITSSQLGVSTWQMQKGNMSDQQVGELGSVIDDIRNLPLYIDDDPDSTISNIRAKAIRQ